MPFEQAIAKLKRYLNTLNCVYFANESMREHTSFKIGGPAELFIQPQSEDILANILVACKKWNIPRLVMGNGSNLLVSDSGFRGAVLCTTGGFTNLEMIDSHTIRCGAGVKTSQLCIFALEHALSGFEFLWGIPGTMGGAAFMNAGAYGSEMVDVLKCCYHLTPDGTAGKFSADQLDLRYRHSVYTDNDYSITGMLLRGSPGDKTAIREKMDDLMARRKSKQPLEYPSAGSIFKRPPNHYAAALIEQCGLKGRSVGGAAVSEKHAGFIINTGSATAADVKALIEQIQQEVFQQTGVQLECEVRMV